MVTFDRDDYLESEDILVHYGTPRHSGRYPWGSGEDPVAARNQTLVTMAKELEKQGLKEADIARGLGLGSTTELRDLKTIARNERKQAEISMAAKLADKGLSNGAIAARMREAGFKINGESQVRNLLKPSQERKAKVLDNVTDTLRNAVDKKEFLDVGAGTEFQLNVTATKLRSALRNLQNEGYQVHRVKVEQATTGKQTIMKVLVKPGVEWGDVQKNRHNIQQLQEYSTDGGLTALGILPPKSISSSRVGIAYAKDGGAAADGTIYVRRGVSDVSLDGAHYAQVRIAVDGTHYIKGMAVYKDDLPHGVDLLFNTNKDDTGNKLDALKPLKRDKDDNVDPDNPFGASIRRQIGEGRDPKTGKPLKLTSVMNLVNEEGDWDKWSNTLSSQMLSKQKPSLAKEQLSLAYQSKKDDLDAILRLTNPSVKRKLLEAYADGADSSAVHLKAAALPRQRTQVLLPVKEMHPNEIYAPTMKDGEHVVLVRFPHGGTFEIPQLTVNNKNPAAKKLLGDSRDAVGIHPDVAARLSGADFDGDTVLVIPNSGGKVQIAPPLEGLKNFEPKSAYPPYDGMRTIDGGTYRAATKKVDYGDRKPSSNGKGLEMGKVSNLITDMTLRGATNDEKARAIRHSMVVIDAEKHVLDYRRSEEENGIAALKKKYQKTDNGSGVGAATLISRANAREDVPERKERPASKGGPIDPKTGKKVFENTNRSWTDAAGKVHFRTMRSTKLAEAEDAHTLSSGTVVEKFYADHSNKLKALANQARKTMVATKPRPYSPSAKQTHASVVADLEHKLRVALKNAPLERQAQVFAHATVRLKKQANPQLNDPDNRTELKRIKAQALTAARLRTGAEKKPFEITDAEWLAIEAGAITAHKLDQILTYADLERIRELATPKTRQALSTSGLSRARSMKARGYTWAEIAEQLGVSVTTIQRELDAEGGE